MYFKSWALGVLCCTSVAADPPLPPILISAARTAQPGLDIPASRTIIDADAIADSGAQSLSELLRQVNGIHVSDGIGDGSNANIDMRGFGSTAQSNVAVLVDGRKINPASDSATLYLNAIDLDNVERIEVVHGSAGTLYGNQAVGGVINVITRRPGRSMRSVQASVGSYDAWELQAGISERLGDQAEFALQAHKRESDNYRDRNASRLERLSGHVGVDHRGGSYSSLDLMLLRDRVQTPGALLSDELIDDRRQAIFPGDHLDTESKVLRIGTRRLLNPGWRLEAELALRDDHRDFVQSFRGFPGSNSTQDRESIELTPRVIGHFGGNVITLGVDHLITDYELVTAFGTQGNDQDISAAYAQLSRSLAASLAATIGIRHAWVDNRIVNGGSSTDIADSLTVGSLGLVYRPNDAWRLFARADQNYRFAKVDEHTNVAFGQPVGLNTQRGISYEIGAEYSGQQLQIAGRAFHLRLRDEISFDATSFSNVNLPRSRRSGLALSTNMTLSSSLRLGAGYEYIDTEITSGNHAGSQVPLVPEQTANLYLEYRPLPPMLTRLDLAYVDERYLGSDFDNASDPLDEYWVADLVAHYSVNHWRISAKVRNLFNESYSETGASSFAGDGFIPAAERNFWVGVSYRFEE